MKSTETLPAKRDEHPSRERCDHANLERPEAHPGGVQPLRPEKARRHLAPRGGREARN